MLSVSVFYCSSVSTCCMCCTLSFYGPRCLKWNWLIDWLIESNGCRQTWRQLAGRWLQRCQVVDALDAWSERHALTCLDRPETRRPRRATSSDTSTNADDACTWRTVRPVRHSYMTAHNTQRALGGTSVRKYVFYVFFRFKKTWLLRFFEMTCQKKRKKSLAKI